MLETLSPATKAAYYTGNHPGRHLNALRQRTFGVINTADTMESCSPTDRCDINHDISILKGRKETIIVKDRVTVTVAAGYISGVAAVLFV